MSYGTNTAWILLAVTALISGISIGINTVTIVENEHKIIKINDLICIDQPLRFIEQSMQNSGSSR